MVLPTIDSEKFVCVCVYTHTYTYVYVYIYIFRKQKIMVERMQIMNEPHLPSKASSPS